MIGFAKAPAPDLATVLAALDFTASNARLAELKTEVGTVNAKAADIRADVDRLQREIAAWRGPDADELADAVMAETDVSAAVDAFPSRERLVERRDTLMRAAAALDERASALRREMAEVEQMDRGRILEALQPHLEAVSERQREAAAIIMAGHAEIAAIGEMCGVPWVSERLPSRQAVEGLNGMNKLLPHTTALPVPETLARLVEPVAERCAAVAGRLPKFVPPA